MTNNSYIAVTIWSFAERIRFLDPVLEFACTLAKLETENLRGEVFDGRHQRRLSRLRGPIVPLLPTRFCSLRVYGAIRATKNRPQQDVPERRLDLSLQIAPLSAMWQTPEMVADASPTAQGLAMEGKAADSYLRSLGAIKFPHHIDLQITVANPDR